VEEILHKAEESEKEYDWSRAAELYEEALNLLPQEDFSRMGEIHERLGFAFYRLAFQAEGNDEFKERLRRAILSYEKAKELYGKLAELAKTPKMLRCEAVIALANYWLVSEASEKKKLVDECWRLTKKALEAFEKAGETREYGNTYNQLSMSVVLGVPLEWDFRAREKTWLEAVERGEQAIKFLSPLGDSYKHAVTYAITATFLDWSSHFVDMDERKRYYQKALVYWQEANKLSEEAAQIGLLSVITAHESLHWGAGSDEALVSVKKALEYGKKTKDRLVIGCGLDWLAFHTMWKAIATEDPDERDVLFKTALQYALDAKYQYSIIAFISPRRGAFWVESQTEYYWNWALLETDLEKRRDMLEKAVESAPDGLKRAEDSGYPDIIGLAHHAFSKALASLALMETSPKEKKKLLEKALEHRNEAVSSSEQLEPFGNWDRGVERNYLGDIKSHLADLTENPQTRRNMLQEAALEKENALKLIIKEAAYWEIDLPAFPSGVALGNFQYEYGRLLNRLYNLTQSKEHLQRAAKAFKDSAESYQKANLTSRVAECHWKAAQAYDDLGEHSKAAEDFDVASDSYKRAAEKVPQLKEFYQNQALYMQAWSEIEKARHHHDRQEYGSAEEHFEKAAYMHKSTKQWSYLAPNYSAWARVEEAEELSRKEQSEEALKAFEEATRLFNESKKSIQTQISKIENPDEKQVATSMVKATDTRREYCMARIAVEEAKILDKKGDHYSSSEKYGVAAETLEKISLASDSEQERKEFKLIITLSKAWQKMTLAEAKSSSALYSDASVLFEQAEDLTPNEKTKMLILGHSRFCKALGAGTRFVDTMNKSMYIDAIESLESAATYYVKAGFPKASDYSEATKFLFDAYVHMDDAARESDPEKKAKLYAMAEKVLQTSAGSFMRADHPEKSEQVLGLLEKARKERELAVSLAEVLHAPSIVSTTSSFATPTPAREEAVGSERFEHADIQANLIIRQKDLRIGENLNVELELVNAGKGSALLTKVTGIIPKGFELAIEPESCRVEDSYLNLKGRRLEPLKTEEVKLVLRPTVQGTFSLKPTVLYLDENGNYKSHEPEPVIIVVKELGIKSWLKGER
jgi:hypothetical protein